MHKSDSNNRIKAPPEVFDIEQLHKIKPGQLAIEQARFYLSLFKRNKLLQQG